MHPDVELLLLALAPIFLLLIAIEYAYWCRYGQAHIYSLKDSSCNAALALMHQGADKLAWLFTLPLFQAIYQHHRLFTFHTGLTSGLLLFVLQDLLYYAFHRASHRVRWLWAAHSVHHSSKHMNFSTALRQSLMYPLAGMWAFWLPLAWVGFAPSQIVAVVLINLAFQFFVHTQLRPSLGGLEYLFNTPAAHSCHHAQNPEYLDRNYAGVLMIWDWLFGSFVVEQPDHPCIYGTVKPVNSFNPLTVTFSEWSDLARQVWNARHWRQRLAVLFAAPGYGQRL